MTSVPTALFAPTTHASFFLVVGAWRYLTTGAPLQWGGLGRWRRGCAARRYDHHCRCCRNNPTHSRHYHRCHWSGAVGSALGGAARLQRARVSRVACECVACFVLGRGSERHVPGSPVRVLTRRSPDANCCPCFHFCSCTCECGGWWAVGFAVRGVRGVPRVRQPAALPAPLPPGYC